MPMPTCSARPVFTICGTIRLIVLIGTAKPMPAEPPVLL